MSIDFAPEIDPAVIERFFAAVLDLIEAELARGTDTASLAVALLNLTSALARRDPDTADMLLELIAKELDSAADQAGQ